MTDPQEAPGPGAVRLIFEYEGDTVRLISQQPVDVAISGLEAAPEAQAGHVVEVRDAGGRRIARVPVRGGFLPSVEVFPEDHAQAITRVDAAPSGAFTVVIPAPAAAAEAVVVRVASPGSPGAAPGEGATSPSDGQRQDVELGSFRIER